MPEAYVSVDHDKKLSEQDIIIAELVSERELHGLAPLELISESRIEDLAMFDTRNSKIGHDRLPKTEHRPCSITENRKSAMLDTWTL